MKKKVCFKCGIPQSLSEFYAHPQMADGHLNKCKTCAKKDVADRAAREPEKLASYERERMIRPERKAAVSTYKKDQRAKDPERFAQYQRDYRKRFRVEVRVRATVQRAITNGVLTRPRSCTVCKKRKTVQAHHDDYNKPLDVRWLCTTCHGLEHRKAS